jgi:hypothetical protein
MRSLAAILLLAVQAPRDVPYAEPKNGRQTLDVFALGEGKSHMREAGNPARA